MDRDEKIETLYLHGDCYPMAIALHRETGLPLRALTAKRNSARDHLPHMAHAWVQPEEGKALDVAGIRDQADLVAEYLGGRPAFTLESAAVEAFGSESEFRQRLRQIFDSDRYWPMYERELDQRIIEATEVVRSYVLPRRLALEAAELAPEPTF